MGLTHEAQNEPRNRAGSIEVEQPRNRVLLLCSTCSPPKGGWSSGAVEHTAPCAPLLHPAPLHSERWSNFGELVRLPSLGGDAIALHSLAECQQGYAARCDKPALCGTN